MMSSNSNINNDNSKLIANLHAHIASMPENSCNYSSFNICLVPNYMNNQIIYYYITSTISAAEQA
jgi:hypothetical protein